MAPDWLYPGWTAFFVLMCLKCVRAFDCRFVPEGLVPGRQAVTLASLFESPWRLQRARSPERADGVSEALGATGKVGSLPFRPRNSQGSVRSKPSVVGRNKNQASSSFFRIPAPVPSFEQ